MKGTTIGAALLLAACGSAESPNWSGGHVGTWQPAGAPVAVMILHQGHDCFTGCRYADSLVPAAERFAAAGFAVYGFEMPPEPHDHGPIERFYKPVLDLLDTLDGSLPVYVAGLSGGGWTTSVVTGLDPRIARGYSVEGDPADSDWEQQNTPLGYTALYAQAGERLVHVYIPGSSTDCAGFGYQYPCVNDYTTSRHEMSPWAVEYIVTDILARL